ncbi:Bifunctional ligase/repressor BirA [Phycisphaerales bacterium]|nr:Bifunctional ligase/repressor BirA [Phycisphaerales bacterium]
MRDGARCVDRVLVAEEANSTQDLALGACEGRPGLIVAATRQTAGRGRLGRAWSHAEGKGLALTVVLPGNLDGGRLSIAAGLAACMMCESAVGGGPMMDGPMGGEWAAETVSFAVSPLLAVVGDVVLSARGPWLGLRWPNDVVEALATGPGRKIAGVLIEKREGLHLVGIGINVLQRAEDWPEDLRERACSLSQLGSRWGVAMAAAALLRTMDSVLHAEDAQMKTGWYKRNTLRGALRMFEHDGRRYFGRVVQIEPTSHIVLATEAGEVRLPAMTTSLVHE